MTGQGCHRGLDFRILKRTVSFLHHYTESKALAVRLDTLALILVKQFDALHDGRRHALQPLEQAGRGNALINDKRQIAGYRRETGHFAIGWRHGFQQRSKFDLEDDRRKTQLVALHPDRVQLTDETDFATIQQHTGRTPRMQRRMGSPLELGDTREKQRFEVGLDVEEIHIAVGFAPLLRAYQTTGQRGQAHRLPETIHRRTSRIVAKAAANLENTNPVGLALAIGHKVGHQPADQA